MNAVIDFNGYLTSENEYIIREYSLLIVTESGKIIKNSLEVSKLSLLRKTMNKITKLNYNERYETYGILETSGSDEIHRIRKNITAVLKFVNYIFVLNENKLNQLIDFIKTKKINEKKFICCDDLGYLVKPKNLPYCKFHDHPSDNNCVIDDVKSMLTWLTSNKFLYSVNRKKIHAVVDFVGYDMPHNAYVVKEISIHIMNHKGNLYKTYYGIVEPPCDFEKLPANYQLAYGYFYDIYGIKWSRETIDVNEFKINLSKYFGNTTYIYVRNSNQKKLLKDSIGDFNCTIICLNKFGYNVPLKLLTKCKNHEKPNMNNCARDNSWNMMTWLQKTKIYKPKMRTDTLKAAFDKHFNK
ncbi:uncharacterized protein LOC130667735 [Microplitis mediator]|uniref:uncharacterized protein LOC130667735 n=1 Tax=Microplitis mediator TaxID=375433 RepID=UPI0025540537|nr:uncharacterized protein LOC130667735 [Microplitis mediator]